MKIRGVKSPVFVAVAALVAVSLHCPPSCAQQALAVPNCKQVLGFENVKPNKKGTVRVDKGTLEFTHGKEKTDLAVTSITDVITGNDSQRAIGGVVGTLSMFGPYGSGRFLSLFRTKIDTITIKYRDDSGGLHGAIFTTPQGKADDIKKELVAEGAKTSIPIEPAAATPQKEAPKQ